MNRTHTCNALRPADAGQTVTLVGWVDTKRDLGGVTFVDLRDRAGVTQVVFRPGQGNLQETAQRLKTESVIEVIGQVTARSAETINSKLGTGAIEVVATSIIVHNICADLPFPMDDDKADKVNEDLRLEYRFLDLRRPRNLGLLKLRHAAGRAIRNELDEQGFLEVETPTLFKSTPEGAREFLVPSRTNPGEFYALTQSPQQYKQMLMVAGVERYYQMARCYRDEDLRADRQPEFTQVDLEMSFIDREDMYKLIEGILKRTWKETLGVDIPTPFPRMSYQEAMDRFGIDKPDTRFGMEIHDFTPLFKNSAFKVFNGAANTPGSVVRAINAKGLADLTQGELTNLETIAKSQGAKGLAFIKVEAGEWKSPITKFFSEEEKAALKTALKIEDGDIIFFAAAPWEQASNVLGRIRLESAALLKAKGRLSLPTDQYNFLWVIEFPLMLWDEEEKRYISAHHPFTAPVKEDEPLLATDPAKVRGQHYDIVLNGVELGGGSIRIHNPAVQKRVFEEILKIPQDLVESRFGYMLKAFSYGAPPHGGIALGFDRVVAMLAGRSSIRDILAFPKNQNGRDLMADCPSPVTAKQLRDLRIRTVEEEAKPKA
ncbi:aspartate--tRNA(Asp/Asn) ligase [Verrucomicrobiota bacterium]|jgi:aspartyl-tRNA synthetase|nr:aspartate--tRNA(Asp/Asn) ligase [Verrucomicrobiota bacterium]